METDGFDLTLTIPHEGRFVPVVRAVAAHAARHVGRNVPAAARFAEQVEEAVGEYLARTPLATPVVIVMRRTTGPLEVLMGDDRLVFEP